MEVFDFYDKPLIRTLHDNMKPQPNRVFRLYGHPVLEAFYNGYDDFIIYSKLYKRIKLYQNKINEIHDSFRCWLFPLSKNGDFRHHIIEQYESDRYPVKEYVDKIAMEMKLEEVHNEGI